MEPLTVTSDNSVALPRVSQARQRLRRGRTFMLAAGDVSSLIVAYVVTLVVSEQIGPLPAVSAPGWFLALVGITAVPIWLGIFTAYHLYDNDTQRISVASFDEVQDLFHAILAGSLGFLILSQGASHLAGWWIYSAVEEFIFVASALLLIPIVRGSIRSWILPRVMKPRRTLIVGEGREARLVHRKLEAHPEYGLDVVGFLGGSDAEGTVPGPCSARTRTSQDSSTSWTSTAILLASEDANHEDMLNLVRTVQAPRRPGVDRSPLLRDLHLPRHPRRGRGNAGRDTGADEPRTKLAPAQAFLRLRRVGSRTARSSLPCSRRLHSRSSSTPAARLSTASLAAAATGRRSASSSFGRCGSERSRIARRCST